MRREPNFLWVEGTEPEIIAQVAYYVPHEGIKSDVVPWGA